MYGTKGGGIPVRRGAGERMSFFENLKQSLAKTRQNFTDRISELVGASAKIDEDFLDELEMILLTADVGVTTTEELIEDVRKAAKKREITGTSEVIPFLKKRVAELEKAAGGSLSTQEVGEQVSVRDLLLGSGFQAAVQDGSGLSETQLFEIRSGLFERDHRTTPKPPVRPVVAPTSSS